MTAPGAVEVWLPRALLTLVVVLASAWMASDLLLPRGHWAYAVINLGLLLVLLVGITAAVVDDRRRRKDRAQARARARERVAAL